MTYMGISICVPTGPSADRICKFNGTPIWLIILIVVVCLAVVGGIGFIVYKKVILPRKNNQGYVKQGSEPALQWLLKLPFKELFLYYSKLLIRISLF